MDLLEYQGKQVFARYGVPVPDGRHAKTVDDAVAGADEIGYPCVVKAQVQIGGRGKAGGIKVAKDSDEARAHAEAILGMDIRGFTVHDLWIEVASDIAEEYYASLIFDRSEKKPLAMLSRMGGMDVEAIAEEDPEAIVKHHIDPLEGFTAEDARVLTTESGIAEDVRGPVGDLLAKLYDAFIGADGMLVEVNPLIVTTSRDVLALDSKFSIDNNALFRQPEIAELAKGTVSIDDPLEQMAKERGLNYVKYPDPDANVGCLGNGAGLAMSTCDVVDQAGGRPANFLDAGGGSKAEAIVAALEVITADDRVRAILFNIFGGITRCDEVAKGIIEAYGQMDMNVPMVVRLNGTNDEEGLQLLADADLPDLQVEGTMLGAAEKVVELAGA